MNQSCHTYEWVMSHIWMSHVTHMNESCHTYESVMSHIWMSHVLCRMYRYTRVTSRHVTSRHGTHIYESFHTYEWGTSHAWTSHVTRMNESCHTFKWVMTHLCISHITHMNEPYHTYEWVMLHVINMSCRTYKWVKTYEWGYMCICIHTDTCICIRTSAIKGMLAHVICTYEGGMDESCHTYEWVMSHTWIRHVTRMIYICVYVYIYARTSSVPSIGLIDIRKNKPTYVKRDLCMWTETCKRDVLIHAHHLCRLELWSDVTHSYVCHDSCIWHTYEWVMAHIWMSHGTHMNESWHTYEWVMAHII